MSSRSIHEKLVALERQMQEAAAAMDFETATRLRNELVRIKGETPLADTPDEGMVTVSQPPPGAMGLGTHVPVRQPPKGWTKPKKPNLMTNVKPKGKR